MADFTPHQKKIVERYYDHRDAIMLNKLQEITTELYLADDAAKVDRLWSRADKAMKQLRVPESIREHVLNQKKIEVLALNVKAWLAQTSGR